MNITANFSVNYRNVGHWDINGERGRIFRIRGTPGRVLAIDERPNATWDRTTHFQTLTACMSFITDQLMFEHCKSDGCGNNTIIDTAQ